MPEEIPAARLVIYDHVEGRHTEVVFYALDTAQMEAGRDDPPHETVHLAEPGAQITFTGVVYTLRSGSAVMRRLPPGQDG